MHILEIVKTLVKRIGGRANLPPMDFSIEWRERYWNASINALGSGSMARVLSCQV